MLTAKHSLQSCLLKSARPHLSTLRLRQLTTMTPELSSSRSLYSQIHSLSNTFNQGWLRKDIITVTRSVRDIDDDRSKLFTEMYDLSPDEGILQPIKGNSFELVRPIFHDISPSGNITLSLKHGGKNDELPLINLSGDQSSHYLDASEYHDKFVGDSWFGGVSWSHDERFVAYVAYKKESKEKLLESTKYFGYRSSDDGVNKFEYVDDWGEKYVGLVSLSLNVLNTVTGEISTVGGIDDTMWTVGQPVFLPDIESDTGKTGKSPSYRLAYTAWKNGPKKLGMIYCYQRESSIFVVDLSNLLAPDSHASVDATKTSPPRNAADISETEIHVLVTPGIKLARSARGSPDGMRMIFLGSKLGFASHNGCSELFCIEVPDIIQLLVEATAKAKERKDGSTGDDKKNDRLSNDILMKTIVPSVACPAIEKGRHMTLKFPGIYADQLPRNCFLNDDCVVMSTPWGSVESIITVILSTGIVRKLDIPHHDLEVSSNILDVQTFKSSSEGSPPSKLLVTISTPSSSQSLAVLDLHAVGELVSVELCPTPDSYMPDQKPITRLKPTKKTSQEDSKTGLEKDAVNNVNDKKIKLHRTIDIRQKLNGEKKFDKLLKWETKKYQDANGIPFESILITPIMTEKGFMGFEDLGTSRKCPLIVVPHGGPHSCMTTTYVASYAFLSLYLGAAVLHVNFRGSTGFGQDSIDALLGNIGTVDVADMVQCTKDALDRNAQLDPLRVGVVGGSHGGFLAAHLIGQYPDLYKVACMRNPVTDLPGMLSVTDIPDWCFVEALGTEAALKYSRNSKNEDDFNSMPDEKDLLKMRACSPIIHVKNVRAPVLMLIGGKDRRVPMSQGVSYYHNLKAKGVVTKLLVFPEDVHAIDRPLSEAEQWIAAADWLETHL